VIGINLTGGVEQDNASPPVVYTVGYPASERYA